MGYYHSPLGIVVTLYTLKSVLEILRQVFFFFFFTTVWLSISKIHKRLKKNFLITRRRKKQKSRIPSTVRVLYYTTVDTFGDVT